MRNAHLASVVLATWLPVILGPGSAYAGEGGCAFDAVAKDRGMKASMVRMFMPCPSSENTGGHSIPNTQTEGGTPACDAVTRYGGVFHRRSSYSFSDRGGCSLQTKGKINPDCSALTAADGTPLGLPAGACHVVDVRARCRGILRDDESPMDGASDDGWKLQLTSRATLHDRSGGDMTVVDLPITYEYGTPEDGEIELSSNSAIGLTNLLGTSFAALPTCTQLNVVDVRVVDPEGIPFAQLGMGTATQADLAD